MLLKFIYLIRNIASCFGNEHFIRPLKNLEWILPKLPTIKTITSELNPSSSISVAKGEYFKNFEEKQRSICASKGVLISINLTVFDSWSTTAMSGRIFLVTNSEFISIS